MLQVVRGGRARNLLIYNLLLALSLSLSLSSNSRGWTCRPYNSSLDPLRIIIIILFNARSQILSCVLVFLSFSRITTTPPPVRITARATSMNQRRRRTNGKRRRSTTTETRTTSGLRAVTVSGTPCWTSTRETISASGNAANPVRTAPWPDNTGYGYPTAARKRSGTASTRTPVTGRPSRTRASNIIRPRRPTERTIPSPTKLRRPIEHITYNIIYLLFIVVFFFSLRLFSANEYNKLIYSFCVDFELFDFNPLVVRMSRTRMVERRQLSVCGRRNIIFINRFKRHCDRCLRCFELYLNAHKNGNNLTARTDG